MAVDQFANTDNKTNPADRHFAIVPSDTTDLALIPRGIYCQADGTVMVRDAAGVDLPYTMYAGQVLVMRPVRILSTGTTGTYYGWF